MVISKLISGLGNQLFQYAIARQISIKTNKQLKLDISSFRDQNLRAFKLNHYNIKAEVASEFEVQNMLKVYTDTLLPAKLYRKVEKYLPKYRRRFFKENEWWIYEPDLYKIRSDVYLEGYWQHYKYFENIDRSILEELTVNETYNQSIQNLIDTIKQNTSISIHIRRGDYISDPNANKLMGVLPIEYYKKAIAFMNNRLDNPSYYIFSDDLCWAKDHLRITSPSELIDIEGSNKDYIELDLMSKCSHNIIANSSFSWWGAFLNRNPNKVVIAPDKWVIPVEINKNIEMVFPSWLKL